MFHIATLPPAVGREGGWPQEQDIDENADEFFS